MNSGRSHLATKRVGQRHHHIAALAVATLVIGAAAAPAAWGAAFDVTAFSIGAVTASGSPTPAQAGNHQDIRIVQSFPAVRIADAPPGTRRRSSSTSRRGSVTPTRSRDAPAQPSWPTRARPRPGSAR